MSPSSGHDAEAPFYDYVWDQLTEDIDFYRRRLAGARTVLDAMCGTGRVSVALARSGHVVVGVDRSEEMLARARRRLAREPLRVRRRVRWFRRDLVREAAGRGLDAAVIAVNSYGLIPNSRDRLRALRNLRRSLRPGGRLLLALDSVRSYRTIRDGVPQLTALRRVGPHGRIYLRIFAETGSDAERVRSESLHLLLSRDGQLLASQESRTTTAVLSPTRVKRELRQAGFVPRTVLGDYDLRPYSSLGSRFIVEAVAA